MKLLRRAEFNVITIRELAAALKDYRPLPPRTVSLTFDDGYENFYTTAFPVLEEHGFGATVFLVTDYCGQNNDWSGNPKNFPRSKVLSWKEIKELSGLGVEFGNHTRTHPDLTRVPLETASREINESKTTIEDALGRQVTSFAYPFGRSNQRIREIAATGHEAGCSTNLGKTGQRSERMALERIDAYYLSDLRVFDWLPTRAFDGYLAVRQTLREIKSALSRFSKSHS
jgi:peptidoglycan/xylan/chitin deacetylase (PgdA/CDA1 family)